MCHLARVSLVNAKSETNLQRHFQLKSFRWKGLRSVKIFSMCQCGKQMRDRKTVRERGREGREVMTVAWQRMRNDNGECGMGNGNASGSRAGSRGSIVNCGLVDLTNCVKLLSLSALDWFSVASPGQLHGSTGGREADSSTSYSSLSAFTSVALSPLLRLLNEHFLASSGADDDDDSDV